MNKLLIISCATTFLVVGGGTYYATTDVAWSLFLATMITLVVAAIVCASQGFSGK